MAETDAGGEEGHVEFEVWVEVKIEVLGHPQDEARGYEGEREGGEHVGSAPLSSWRDRLDGKRG